LALIGLGIAIGIAIELLSIPMPMPILRREQTFMLESSMNT
jgi:hypothetical protein